MLSVDLKSFFFRRVLAMKLFEFYDFMCYNFWKDCLYFILYFFLGKEVLRALWYRFFGKVGILLN